MAFDQDLTACAALVERADPDRFRATMAAPVAARRVLFPMYAMNVEVARAPWVTTAPMIAEMRLQWWRDALAEIATGTTVRRHEVVTPLAAVLKPDHAVALDQLVVARRWDIYSEPFEGPDDLKQYIEQTAGTLFWVSASALGPALEPAIRDFGFASGVANWLCAVPDLYARGRLPLVDAGNDAIRRFAGHALARLHRARALRETVSRSSVPAMLAGWRAGPILAQAEAEPWRVMAGRLSRPGGGALSLTLRAATRRW